jgi:hypothetical protein
MLALRGSPRQFCDSVPRRDFLRIGGLGALGLSAPTLLRAAQVGRLEAPRTFGRARRCLLLFLTGGPSHIDTFDMKPSAPDVVRGEFRPVPTTVPDMEMCELFPQLAKHAHRLCVVRSVTHPDNTHTSAGYTMLTGVPHPLANAPSADNIRPTPDDHPHVGSLIALIRSDQGSVPPFVSLPEVIKDAAVNTFPGQDGGFTGHQYSPFQIDGNAARTGFELPDVFLPQGISESRIGQREALLTRLDASLDLVDDRTLANRDVWYQKAFEVLRAPELRRAFDLEHEPAALRERYGPHLFGQGCLLGRRLLEAGVSLVTVYWHYEGPEDSPVWDTHQNNFDHLRKRLIPPTDVAFATLLDDLGQRGLLADTLVVCMGEFGRTPRINVHAGRDHWGPANSILLAGAGIAAGRVYGATDRHGAHPVENAVSPADITATILHLLGVPEGLEIQDRTGRRLPACTGSPIAGVLA